MGKEKFLQVYSNLPSQERSNIIGVVDGKPYSWDAAYEKILNDTPTGKKILNQLEKLKIL